MRNLDCSYLNGMNDDNLLLPPFFLAFFFFLTFMYPSSLSTFPLDFGRVYRWLRSVHDPLARATAFLIFRIP